MVKSNMTKTITVKFIKGITEYHPIVGQDIDTSGTASLCKDGLAFLNLISDPYPDELTITAKNKNPKKKGFKRYIFKPRMGRGERFYLICCGDADGIGSIVVSVPIINIINSLRNTSDNEMNTTLWLKAS